MELQDLILELKAKEERDPLSRVSCDILRSLFILHGSGWESELSQTLNELWALRGVEEGMMEGFRRLIFEALKLLNGKGVIVSERRLRADLSRESGVEEALHKVKDFTLLVRVFSGDVDVVRYQQDVMGYGELKFPQ